MHTPGPWRIAVSADHTPAITVPVPEREGSGFVIAHISRLPRMGSVAGDMDDNARLIAAAPYLLSALKAARSTIASFPASMGYDISDLREIDAAIAKAEGK